VTRDSWLARPELTRRVTGDLGLMKTPQIATEFIFSLFQISDLKFEIEQPEWHCRVLFTSH
jgi:hypothetical protein